MTESPVLLAFDTSTTTGSVAVARGDHVVARRWLLERREHASRLVPEVATALEAARVSPEEIDGLVVGRGPGSFTGLRIAAATAKGLARALAVPLWHHSSLAAAAASLEVEVPEALLPKAEAKNREVFQVAADRPRYVLFDARSERVYAACYWMLPDRLTTLIEPTGTTITRILETGAPDGAVFCGDGAVRHSARLSEAGYQVLALPLGLPTAEGLLRIHHALREEDGQGEIGPWEPEYLRGSPAAPPRSSRG